MQQSSEEKPTATQFILITGLSGAGKGVTLRHFEDFGFFCIDNLPPALLPMFAELCERGGIGRAAIVVDVRGGTFFHDLNEAIEKLHAQGIRPQILFLDADDERLVQRFKETRRRHPLSDQFPDLHDAIRAERSALESLREQAAKIVQTSNATPRELRDALQKAFVDSQSVTRMLIQVQSFGFKHGVPSDADLMFDVRFLPNPNYDRAIGHLDGYSREVQDYVMRDQTTQEFLGHLERFLDFCVPHYEAEGKSYLIIAIGCTGGRHRSVVLTNWLTEKLRAKGFRAMSHHRDLQRSSAEGTTRHEAMQAHEAQAADEPRAGD